MSLSQVHISEKGIVKNILSLNYTHQTTVKEYLNNVLDKNPLEEYPDYEIQFSLKKVLRTMFLFDFVEKNCRGFLSLVEIQSAFSIAESDRKGANNMGYGIYSPITINKDHKAYGLFIQSNERGTFYSTVYFGSVHSKIWTKSGEFTGTTILGQDVSQLLVPGGTRCVWVTVPDSTTEDDDVNLDAFHTIKKVIKFFKKSLTKDGKFMDGDTETEINELGKYYNHYLKKGVPISYGELRLTPTDILLQDNKEEGWIEHTYPISVMSYDDGKTDIRIKDRDVDDEWHNFTTTAKPIGIPAIRRYHAENQYAMVKIYDLDLPKGKNTSRKLDRKIWVKINDTYIFCEDFPLNGWPNIRVVLELTNEGDNNFDCFISPDANKSNSKVNTVIKDRISQLVKSTIKTYFTGNTVRVQISDTLKHDVWMNSCGNVCKAPCKKCSVEMTAWKYDVVRLCGGGGDKIDNLIPICKACVKRLE